MKDNGSNGYLVGSKLTLADIGLFEVLLWVEELTVDELQSYSELQVFLFKKLKNYFF